MPTKVIIVSFHNRKKHPLPYSFGSIAAIFTRFTESEIGITEQYLSHSRQLHDSNFHITPRCSIFLTQLIRSPKNK